MASWTAASHDRGYLHREAPGSTTEGRMMVFLQRNPGQWLIATVVIGLLALVRLDALTLADLLDDSRLTPRRFANHFEGFRYEYGAPILPAEIFLARRAGDCDDYAVLADHVLTHHGYETRMIHVRMVGRVAHAVCYVTETKAYLDFNNRVYMMPLERSGSSIRQIATKVARSFRANWTSASEFTYTYEEDRKHFGTTILRTEPASLDPDTR